MPSASADGVKLRRERFAREYLVDFHATNAYIRAGYAARGNAASVNAYKLLKDPAVQAVLAAESARHLEKAEIDGQRVIQEAARIAFGDLRDIFDDGGMLLSPKKLSDRVAAAIESIEFVQRPGQGAVMTKVKRYDKLRALEILAKYFKLTDQPPPAQWSFDPATLAKMTTEDLQKALEHADMVQRLLAGKPAGAQ